MSVCAICGKNEGTEPFVKNKTQQFFICPSCKNLIKVSITSNDETKFYNSLTQLKKFYNTSANNQVKISLNTILEKAENYGKTQKFACCSVISKNNDTSNKLSNDNQEIIEQSTNFENVNFTSTSNATINLQDTPIKQQNKNNLNNTWCKCLKAITIIVFFVGILAAIISAFEFSGWLGFAVFIGVFFASLIVFAFNMVFIEMAENIAFIRNNLESKD